MAKFAPLVVATVAARRNELLSQQEVEAQGIVWRGNSSAHRLMSTVDSLPDEFTWCNQDGVNYCTASRNQHIPQYCGSCWAHGAVSALQDRIKIKRGAQEGADIILSVQHVLNCQGGGSCYGGSVDGPYQWIHQLSQQGTGISYETSMPYSACSSDSDEGFCGGAEWTCDAVNVARTCGSFDQEGGDCVGLNQYPNASISNYGSISGKQSMMQEIMSGGPISCGIDANPLLNYEQGIVTETSYSIDHVISVVGWGNDASKGGYWIVRNSWGEFWGEMGYVRVGFGALNVESQCSYADVQDYTAPEKSNQVHCHEGGDNCLASAETTKPKLRATVVERRRRSTRRNELLSREETESLGVVWKGSSSNQSHKLRSMTVPEEFTWCNKDGKNYCTSSRNQHIPQYCGSCWAHGAVSALQDRVKIARDAQGPDVILSVQHMLNCGGVGSCHGGSVDGPYQWIKSISENGPGISYESSQPYQACSSESSDGFCPKADWTCTPANVARTCGSFDSEGGDCTGLNQYPNVRISNYKSVDGRDAMQQEILANGPISCGIDAMPILNYEQGIVTETSYSTDHVISVVGWGNDATEGGYWIVRNSWGEYWGEMSYVRVAFGALNVESHCAAAEVLDYTAAEKNNQPAHCHEGGDNCQGPVPAPTPAVPTPPAPTPAPTPPAPPTPVPAPTPGGDCTDNEDSYYCDYVVSQSWCDLIGSDCLKSCNCCDDPSACGAATPTLRAELFPSKSVV